MYIIYTLPLSLCIYMYTYTQIYIHACVQLVSAYILHCLPTQIVLVLGTINYLLLFGILYD